jgi:hypothetical protein
LKFEEKESSGERKTKMESKEKGMDREAKRQGVMVKKLKRGVLVGKRGGPCTPPPTWRLEFSSHKNDNTTADTQEFLTFPNTATTSISARKLCASLWEIQPHQRVPVPLAKMRKGGARTRLHRHHHRGKGLEVSKHLVDPQSPPDSVQLYLTYRTFVLSFIGCLNVSGVFFFWISL